MWRYLMSLVRQRAHQEETKTETKRFHLSQVLDVVTGYLVSNVLDYSGLREILAFMTGDDVSTLAFGRAADECKPALLRQFPVLASPEMQVAFEALVKARKEKEIPWSVEGFDILRQINNEWLSKVGDGTYGVRLTFCGAPSAEEIRARGELALILGKYPNYPHEFPRPVCDYFLEVAPLPGGVHKHVDFVQELVERVPPEKLVIVRI